MKNLERYLETVGIFLPRAQKDDILKELSENIRARMEDQEAELGRPLNETEQDAILKGYGNPLVVAGRYGSDSGGLTFGRQLIGPGLFRLYVRILALNLVFALVTAIVLNLTLHLSPSGTFSRFVVQALMQSAVVTFIFALLQHYLNTHPDQWDVLINPDAPTQPQAKTGPRVSRLESFLQIILLFIFASVVHGLLAAPTLTFAPFQPAPIWYQLYWPLMLYQVVSIAQSSVNLFRPDWVRFQAAVQVGLEVAALIMLGVLLLAGNWVVLVGGAVTETGALREVLNFVNQYIFYGLMIAGGVSIVQLLFKIRHLRRSPPDRA